jgi:hypothetical protein
MHFILISWRNTSRHSDILSHLFSAYLLLAPVSGFLIGLYIFDSGFIFFVWILLLLFGGYSTFCLISDFPYESLYSRIMGHHI